jgi:very-short-patch-repair endonuclease
MRDRLFLGTEALATGELTRRDLRRRYTMVHRNVYSPAGVELTAADRARAAWLWSDRRATLVGHSAAALLGSKWVPADLPAEVAHTRRGVPNGIAMRSNCIRADELSTVDGITCTTVARTGYDLGRRLPLETAVIRIDALLNAASASPSAIEAIAARYPGARGIRRLRRAIDLVDAGAESPQESRLRLLLVQSGLPRPVTQIPVTNQWGRVVRRIDMGWPEWMVGVEYDGEQHFDNADDYANDIVRLEFLADRGWTIVRVSARQLRHERPEIVARVRRALERGGM